MVGLAFVLTAAAQPSDDNGWQVGQPRLTTPWTDQVSPSNALPEYPRPQLTRARWQNLNGVWQFAGASAGEAPPVGEDLAESILVPYPTESALSGIERHEDHMWYRRRSRSRRPGRSETVSGCVSTSAPSTTRPPCG